MGCVVLRVMLNIKEVKKFHFTLHPVENVFYVTITRGKFLFVELILTFYHIDRDS